MLNLRSVDLNLLVIFDALMTERHVSRAAMRIPMSQPAMSNALGRLRHVFKDELFIRAGGAMEPTPRAQEIGEAVKLILRQAERLLSSDRLFEPGSAQRQFTVRMSDLIAYLVLPAMLDKLSGEAPGITLDVLHMSPERSIKALEADQLDLAISTQLRHGANVRSETLFPDQMVCIMRKDHPLAGARLTLTRFLQADHIRVAMSPTDIRFVDNVLAEMGSKRKVVTTVPNWLLLPPLLAKGQAIAVTSKRLAAQFGGASLVARPLPFASPPFTWDMYWQRRYDNSPAHTWLRGLVRRSCTTV